MFPVFRLLKIHLEKESPKAKIGFFFGYSVTLGCHEPFTCDSKKVYNIHNFIFCLVAVTVRKTYFAFVVLQMPLF